MIARAQLGTHPLLVLAILHVTCCDVHRRRLVEREEITVLMGSDALVHGGVTERLSGDHVHRLWMENWTSPADSFSWPLQVPVEAAGAYHVRLLACSHFKMASAYAGGSSPVRVELLVVAPHGDEAGGSGVCFRPEQSDAGASCRGQVVSRVEHTIAYTDAPVMMQFERLFVPQLARLPAGACALVLRAVAPPDEGAMNLQLLSVELAHESALAAIAEEREALRADPTWLQEADFGLFIHWNSFSLPLDAPLRTYQQAVADFDVEAFADMASQAGCDFVVWTTTWAGYFFPAPIAAVDAVLPGRTTARDLVADLIESLAARGMRLVLYYHYGKDDAEWWSAARFHMDKAFFWEQWLRVISEVGTRYGAGLAGWWIDDAMTGYYPAAAPWRRMWPALKAGHAARLVPLPLK